MRSMRTTSPVGPKAYLRSYAVAGGAASRPSNERERDYLSATFSSTKTRNFVQTICPTADDTVDSKKEGELL